MLDENAPHAARIHAANSLLDRGFGKPKETVDVNGKVTLEDLVLASMRVTREEAIEAHEPEAIAAAPVVADEPVAITAGSPRNLD